MCRFQKSEEKKNPTYVTLLVQFPLLLHIFLLRAMRLLLADLHPPEPSRRPPPPNMCAHCVKFPLVAFFVSQCVILHSMSLIFNTSHTCGPLFFSLPFVSMHVAAAVPQKNTTRVDFRCLKSLPQSPRSNMKTNGSLGFSQ